MNDNAFYLGDMLVSHRPPAKLLKAAAVIAAHLHDTLDSWEHVRAQGWSKRSCVWASLTVRDFLRKIGFNAQCVTVTVLIQATLGSKVLHNAAIGHPHDNVSRNGGWPGHLVVVVDGFIIDTTLYQVNRPAWKHLPGMVMIKTEKFPGQQWEGLDAMCGIDMIEHGEPEYRCGVLWLNNDTNKSWKAGPDAQKDRRAFAVKALADKFTWRDGHGTTSTATQAS